MQTPTGDVEIANAALTMIRAQPVESLSDADRRSVAVANVYYVVLDHLLTVAPWYFANGFSRLSPTTSDLKIERRGWLNSHALPAERIGPPSVICVDPTKPERLEAYELTADQVLSDEPVLFARVTKRVAPVNWPGYFKSLMVTALAAKLAEPIRGDAALGQRFHQDAFGTPREGGQGGLFKEARDQDHKARPPEAFTAGEQFLADRDRLNEYSYRF